MKSLFYLIFLLRAVSVKFFLKKQLRGDICNISLLILKFTSTENLRDGRLVRKEAVEPRAVQRTKGLGSSVHRLSLRSNKSGGSPDLFSENLMGEKSYHRFCNSLGTRSL